ncbi:UDP-N-acetylmuramoyl-tripeptide--D-alanyl-D-alanine ligase [Desulfallas thermosapovorans DSM 6562]|uniref:UDP-N-acetylmuramoyl-tripeptide--D-alanyl-D-alanine ligase n=2 Tax=Desulfallas thermosapovorans TaxID=58137 RepID=A0A5S4ZSK4_9FIRM|nr:UDP-N-acetylmuramoyl-tripeptide--D-alanyl-D-alanine ligase [Desulfallas thermosapovorans]TYO95919.1 UDP-N-acetylmuramoyl-tripeptide--D-alanyl-D-alanine ligase [Desulfallas thermosapovorans DSM 6562]
MKRMTVGEIYRAIGGRLLQGDEKTTVSRVCTDTRQIMPGDLFFALRGEKYDAHDFLNQAAAGGASALVVSRVVDVHTRVPLIKVGDTLAGLQALAAYHRRQFAVPVVGITGSSGKTTTKDMVAAVLESSFKVLKTRGNYNNEIGLPLTLLEFSPEHGVAVVEMAMRGPGEINALCQIARPTCAIITNIGVAHLERLGSPENIARAKGEILDHIPADGFALLPGDSPLAREQARRCHGKVLFFGLEPGMDIYAADVRRDGAGNRFTVAMGGIKQEISLPLPGRHNVQNALAAFGAGILLGLTPEQAAAGLSRVTLSGMRLDIADTVINGGTITIVNDAYNANPDSACAALQSLEEIAAGSRRTVAVLGDMLELGSGAVAGHRRVGTAAVRHRVAQLVTVGELSRETAEGARLAGGTQDGMVCCRNNEEALAVLQETLKPGDVVLVKGSRGMRMEEIIKGLLKD